MSILGRIPHRQRSYPRRNVTRRLHPRARSKKEIAGVFATPFAQIFATPLAQIFATKIAQIFAETLARPAIFKVKRFSNALFLVITVLYRLYLTSRPV